MGISPGRPGPVPLKQPGNERSSPRFDVLGVGSALVDVLVQVPDGFPQSKGLASGSMSLVDLSQAESLRAAAMAAATAPAQLIAGGSALNTVAGVARFGGAAACLARVADDEIGRSFVSGTREAGVHFVPSVATKGTGSGAMASGRCLALITPDAERTMCTYLGAASQLSQADLDPDLLARTDLLYVEGYLWDLAETIEALRSAMSEAKAAGAKVAFSLSDAFCVERHRDEFLELMDSDLDLVFANEAEVLLLYGTDDFDQTVKRLAGSRLTAALTRGPGGSVVVSEGEVLAVDAHPVDKVVDTTGAGDLYAAGFLFGMSRARSWTDCAQLGSLAAAEVISHVGARPEADLVALAQDQGLI